MEETLLDKRIPKKLIKEKKSLTFIQPSTKLKA
jgi:hypothetical protein